MPDASFDDEYLASLYDRIAQHGRADERFYAELAHSAPRVLDVGCGTGALLCRLRHEGHTGRLVGVDPAAGMLAQARRRNGSDGRDGSDAIEWVQGYLPDLDFDGEFDLAYMSGHAFQVLPDNDAVLDVLTAVRRALAPGGRFAFETRNPLGRAWERWGLRPAARIVDADERTVGVRHDVLNVTGELVTFTETFEVEGGETRVSRSTLRFADAATIDRLLRDASFALDERYGDWDRRLFTADSPEIISVASVRART